nr:hypothetical protein [Tanacetum cinerariifolium]
MWVLQKASARKKKGDSASSTTPLTPTPTTTAESAPRLSATAKGKQPLRATTPVEPTDLQRTEAEQLKLVLKRSRQKTHISQQSGSGTGEGTVSASPVLVAGFVTVVTRGVVFAIALALLGVIFGIGSHGWRQLVDIKNSWMLTLGIVSASPVLVAGFVTVVTRGVVFAIALALLGVIFEQMPSYNSIVRAFASSGHDLEFIKSGVENLIPIPSECEGIPEHVCDVPSHDNSPPLDVSKDQIKDFFESNKEFSLIDDDSFSIDDIGYVEASPPGPELASSEVMEIVIPEIGGIDDDILLTINHNDLREKLRNVNLLIAKIKALNANPAPSFDCKTKSSSTSLNSLLDETNTFDNSLPEFETFCFDVEEISSGSTTTHPDLSLSKYKAFHDDHIKEISSGSPTTHSDSFLYASFMFDLSINPFPPTDRSDSYEFTDELIPFISALEYDCFLYKVEPNSEDFTKDVVEDMSPTKEPQVLNVLPTHPSLQLNMKFQPSSESLFIYVVWIFLPFLVYSVIPPYLLSLRNEISFLIPAFASLLFLCQIYLIGVELSRNSILTVVT